MRSILQWNVPKGGRCAQAHTAPRVQARPKEFPKRHFFTSFAKSWSHTSAGHCNSCDFPREASSQRQSLIGILQAPQRYVQGYDWVFEVRLSPVFACLHCPKGCCFLTLTWLFGSYCPTHVSVLTVQLFLFFTFKSFVNCLAESMPVRSNQRRPPSVVINVVQCSNFLNSQC